MIAQDRTRLNAVPLLKFRVISSSKQLVNLKDFQDETGKYAVP